MLSRFSMSVIQYAADLQGPAVSAIPDNRLLSPDRMKELLLMILDNT